MARSQFRTFIIEGVSYFFSVDAFKNAFLDEKARRKEMEGGCTADQLREDIAESLSVSSDTVKKWYQGNNGPGDLGIVKALADFFRTDYMNFLREKGEQNMNKEAVVSHNGEKDVVLSVFHKIVEAGWLESSRFKENYYGGKYQEPEVFINRHKEIYDEAFEIVDMNSLVISYDTRVKLYNILADVRKTVNLDGLSSSGRWLRLNPIFFDARALFVEGEIYGDEDCVMSKLSNDIQGTMERPYCVNVGMSCCTGFTKDTTREEAANNITIFDLKPEDIELVPYDDELFDIQYSSSEIYRFEFMKTVLLIFREDFPEIFG